MNPFSFYLNDPFVFSLKTNFNSIFPTLDAEDIEYISQKNGKTDLIKQNIKKVFKALLLKRGFIYDNDSGLLQVDEKYNRFPEYFVEQKEFIKILNFLNDTGFVFYHHLLLLIMCKFNRNHILPDYLKHLSSSKFKKVLELKSPVEKPFRVLTFNDNNSCYIDTVLMALFTEPSDFIKQRIFESRFTKKVCNNKSISAETDIKNRNKIKKEIKKIYNFIQINESKEDEEESEESEEESDEESEEESEKGEEEDEDEESDKGEESKDDEDDEKPFHFVSKSKKEYTCTTLRKKFKKCEGSQAFHSSATQDAGEFLMYLLNIFELETLTQITYNYGSKSLKEKFMFVSKIKDEKAFPVVTVTEIMLMLLDKDATHVLTKFMIYKDLDKFGKGNEWKPSVGEIFLYRKSVIKKVAKEPFIVFDIKRGLQGGFTDLKMYPPEMLFMPSFKTLHLSAIVMHNGGYHYVAVIRRDGVWWYYNDMGTVIYKIGTYNQMLEFGNKSKRIPNPMKNGTLYFYT
jgi:hypothetical protein